MANLLAATTVTSGMLCSACFVGILSFIEMDKGHGNPKMELDLAGSQEIKSVFSKLKGKCVRFSLKDQKTHKLSTLKWWDKEGEEKCEWERDYQTKGKDLEQKELKIIEEICHNKEWNQMSEFAGIQKSNKPIVWYTLCLYLAREFEREEV